MNAGLVFLGESAFSPRPPIRATGAPRGETPRVVEPFNWEKLSEIGCRSGLDRAFLAHTDLF